MARKILVGLNKGGVGKTTTACNLGAALARVGKRVVVVDMDAQGHCGVVLLGKKPPITVAQVIYGEVPLLEAVLECRENLFLLPGGKPLVRLARSITLEPLRQEEVLKNAVTDLEKYFQYVIIDSAPGWDVLSLNSMVYCEEVMLPINMEPLSIDSFNEYEQNIETVRAVNHKLHLKYVVPTFFDRRNGKSHQIMERLKAVYGDMVTDPIRFSVRLSESPAYGQTIFDFDPRGAALDYEKLAERVMADGE